MLRSIAELAAYGIFAALLIAASLAPASAMSASSASTIAASPGRGQLLFATKGCIGCHVHRAIPSARMQAGPDLTDLAARAAARVPGLDAQTYVRVSLRDPGAYRVAGYNIRMPDLHLSDEEIASLSAFLLADTR